MLVLPPERLGVHRVLADQVRRHALDDRLGGEIGLGELRDRLAPADLAVVGGDLDEAEMAERVEVVRLRIADRDGLDRLAIRISTSLADRAAEQRHAFDADIDLDQPAGHRRAGDVERSHVAAEERAALAEDAVEDGAAGLQEVDGLPFLSMTSTPPAADRGDPEVAVGVDLEAVGDVALPASCG